MNLSEIYQISQNLNGFEKELYGSLYKLLGGKKEVQFTRETEWYLRFLYYLFNAVKSFENKEKSFNQELRILNLEDEVHMNFSQRVAIRHKKEDFVNLKLNYYKNNVVEKSMNELKDYGFNSSYYGYKGVGYLRVTLLDKDGYLFDMTDLNFIDSNYIDSLIKFFTKCYISLKCTTMNGYKLYKNDEEMIISYISRINQIFEKTNLRIIE